MNLFLNRDFLFNEIIRRNETKLRKKIASTFFSKVNLDDVYQDVCIHILVKIRNENDENLSKWEAEAWLMTVTNNFCTDKLRSLKSHKQVKKYILVLLDDFSEVDRKLFASKQSHFNAMDPSLSKKEIDINKLMKFLNERDQMIIVLRFFRNYSIRDIDIELGLNNSAVYIERAVEKLRKVLNVDRHLDFFDQFFSTDFDDN
ncbi:MAG: sigma-70 family RNA polymerase sigma factor [Bacteroidetes bacterium]|nr:sigma-70 family RNA polymerase sigma factor [Bacteroidota bacterium]